MNTKIKKVIIIGGFKKYGAGKIIAKVSNVLKKESIEVNEIEFKGFQLFLPFAVIRNIKNTDLIIFQGSIYKFSFLRDLYIAIFLKFIPIRKIFVVLSELSFGNIFLRYKFFFNWLFNGDIISMAKLPQFSEKKNLYLIKPIIEKNSFQISFDNDKICFIHVGYISRFKGWDSFNELAEKNSEYSFFSLGSYLNHDKQVFSNNNKFLESKTTDEIFKNLKIINISFTPYLIFSSRNDLFPLVIPEMMRIKIPICVLKESYSEKILKRFCPQGTYISYETLHELSDIDRDALEDIVLNARKFSETCNTENFHKIVMESIRGEDSYV